MLLRLLLLLLCFLAQEMLINICCVEFLVSFPQQRNVTKILRLCIPPTTALALVIVLVLTLVITLTQV